MKRTRQLLQGALRTLLCTKPLDEIGVQDITEIATVNRATFYDHYTDKFALFHAMIASDFHKLLDGRNIRLEGSCSSGWTAIILAVCDYLQETGGDQGACLRQGSFAPLMDAAITLAIRRRVLEGLHPPGSEFGAPREVIASAASWAIYGGAKELYMRAKPRPDEKAVSALVRAILALLEEQTAPLEKRKEKPAKR